VIGFRTDDKHGQMDCGEIDPVAFGLKLATRELVVQIELAQVLRVHTARHASTVGVPGHQIIR